MIPNPKACTVKIKDLKNCTSLEDSEMEKEFTQGNIVDRKQRFTAQLVLYCIEAIFRDCSPSHATWSDVWP